MSGTATANLHHQTDTALPCRLTDAHSAGIWHTVLRQIGCDAVPCRYSTVGVMGFRPGVGATTVAYHLACAAQSIDDARVLLVDAHFDSPVLHRHLSLPQAPGMAECVAHDLDIEKVCQTHEPSGLSVLVSGTTGSPSSRVYASESTPSFVAKLNRQFDMAILDLPPANRVSCVANLAPQLDAVIVVVRRERLSHDVVRSTFRRLTQQGTHVACCLLNNVRGANTLKRASA